MMMNCKDASKLASKKLDTKLTTYEGIKLKLHLMICKACRIFEAELKLLDLLMKQRNSKVPKLRNEAKSKLQKLVKEHG